tara:strand:- start:268 stop:423 length:156 start_codon:yes stop_codon:yes gene_type:complete
MPSISGLINKRIANLINRFGIPKVPPQMLDEINNNIQIDNQLEAIGSLKDT